MSTPDSDTEPPDVEGDERLQQSQDAIDEARDAVREAVRLDPGTADPDDDDADSGVVSS